MTQIPPAISDPPPRKKRRWVLVLFLVLLSMGLLFSLLMNGILFMGMVGSGREFGARDSHPEDQHPQYEERWSYGYGEAKVVRLSLQGMIAREMEGGLFAPPVDQTEELLRQISAAQSDESVQAIILEVDSPGGMIGPSDELYTALMNFRGRADGPKVIAFTRDLAASGGYYVGIAADWFMAEPTAVVGSIGVIMQSINMKGLSEKIGITDVTIKSGQNKDLLNPFQDPDPEQMKLLQDVIDDMYVRFRNIVAERRNIEEGELEKLADGRIFSAKSALKENLIDDIGYWGDVVTKATELVGEDVRIVRYEKDPTFWEMFGRVQQPVTPLSGLFPSLRGPQIMYLWSP